MGIGIIGASSAAAEAFPMGATSVVTEGFSSAPRQDVSVSLSPGTYLVNSTSQDGTPVFFYAPNSKTTAIAMGDKPAVLKVTVAETQLRITACPTVIDNVFANSSFEFSAISSRAHQIVSADYNPTSGTLAMVIYYYDGATNYYQLWTTTDGTSWSQRWSTTNSMYWIRYFPQLNAWASNSGNTTIISTNDGSSWSQGPNAATWYNPPVYEASTGRIIAIGDSGIFSYSSITNFRDNSSIANITSYGGYHIAIAGPDAILARHSSGYYYTTNGGTNFANVVDGGDYNRWENFDQNPAGIAILKGDFVIGGRTGNTDWTGKTVVMSANGRVKGGGSIDAYDANPINNTSSPVRTHAVLGPSQGSDRGVIFGQQSSALTASIDGINFFVAGRIAHKGIFDSGFNGESTATEYTGRDGYAWHKGVGVPIRLGNKFGFKVYSTNFTNL